MLYDLFVGAILKRPWLQNGRFIHAGRRSWSCIKIQTKGSKGLTLRTLKNLDSNKNEEEGGCVVRL